MYRLVLYGLLTITALAMVFGLVGVLPFSVVQLILSLGLALVACYVTNVVFSKVFKAPTNIESAHITALILFLIMPPVKTTNDAVILVLTCFIAMASKYIFAVNKHHLFNPAALAAVLSTYLLAGGASWWVGSFVLIPATTIIGLLIVHKIRRWHLFLAYVVTSVATLLTFHFLRSGDIPEFISQLITSWPIIFFGTIMLTEPLTAPPTKQLQILYGAVVGLLFGLPFSLGPLYFSPEMALVLGNVCSYVLAPRRKILLRLKEKIEHSSSMHDFVFTPDQKLAFFPGQYLEWTLPHHSCDSRGNRRYFTVASSPTESEIRLGVKIPHDTASTFKQALLSLKKNEELVAGQLAGDFILPEDSNKKLVFIAGGIGVTPFRSMIKFLTDTKQKRDIVLLYAASDPSEFMYQDVFAAAIKNSVTTHYVITHQDEVPSGWSGQVGRITAEMIKKLIPDFQQRAYYLSGPQAMVKAYESILATLGVPRSQVVTDYFPGF